MRSVAEDQTSVILPRRSPSVMTPWANWRWTLATSFSEASMILSLSAGRIMSLMPMEAPDWQAHSKPRSLSLSRVSMVRSWPAASWQARMSLPRVDLVTLSFQKPISAGQISLKMTRPTRVTMTLASGSPLTRSGWPKSGFLNQMRSWTVTAPSSKASLTSSEEPKRGRRSLTGSGLTPLPTGLPAFLSGWEGTVRK